MTVTMILLNSFKFTIDTKNTKLTVEFQDLTINLSQCNPT